MLFAEQDLYVNNSLNILNEAIYLSEDESLINPATIPVKEVSRLGYGVVRFDDVEKLSEDYGCDYIDAMYAIAEASDMNPEYLAVSVPEEDIIAYPEIVNELANIVVQPLSEYDFEYQFVVECVDAWLNSDDDDYLAILEAVPKINKDGSVDISNSSDEEIERFLQNRSRAATKSPSGSVAQRLRTTTLNQKAADVMNATIAAYNKRRAQEDENEANSWGAPASNIDPEAQNTNSGWENIPAPKAQNTPAPKAKVSLTRPGSKKKRTAPSMFQRGKHAVMRAPGNFVGAMKGYGNILSGKTQITGSNGEQLSKFQMLKQHAAANKGSTAVAAGLGAAAIGGGIYAYKQYKNKPKSVIGKRIAALRGIYKNFMQQAQKNPQKAGMFKRIAAKILSVIDKLMGYLQNAAG